MNNYVIKKILGHEEILKFYPEWNRWYFSYVKDPEFFTMPSYFLHASTVSSSRNDYIVFKLELNNLLIAILPVYFKKGVFFSGYSPQLIFADYFDVQIHFKYNDKYAEIIEIFSAYFKKKGLNTLFIENSLLSKNSELSVTSPCILLKKLNSIEDYLQEKNKKILQDSKRCLKKLKELGEVQFNTTYLCKMENSLFLSLIKQLMEWKNKQYKKSGLREQFSIKENIDFMLKLNQGELSKNTILSTLTLNNRLIAIHLGGVCDKNIYYWFPTYDDEMKNFSPGRLLLLSLIEYAITNKFEIFDFTQGDEGYKYKLSNFTRSLYKYKITGNENLYSLKIFSEKLIKDNINYRPILKKIRFIKRYFANISRRGAEGV